MQSVEALWPKFIDICSWHETVDIAGQSIMLKVRQHHGGGGLVDSADRVVVGAAFLRDLVQADL